jgi:ABC-2 type transport system permease protein
MKNSSELPINAPLSVENMNAKRVLNIYLLETKYELLKTLRSPSFAIPALLFPVMFYLFFGVLFNHGKPEVSTYLLVTYGTFGVMGPALFTFGVGLAIERGQGWLDIKEASPMPASAHILARILVAMFFSLLIVLCLFTVAWALAGVALLPMQWLGIALVLVFGSLPFCLFGLSLGMVLKANSAPAIVNLIYLPISFFSGLWIPVTMFPGTMQTIAGYLPPYHLAQLALKITGHGGDTQATTHISFLLGFSVLFFACAILAYRKKDKQ